MELYLFPPYAFKAFKRWEELFLFSDAPSPGIWPPDPPIRDVKGRVFPRAKACEASKWPLNSYLAPTLGMNGAVPPSPIRLQGFERDNFTLNLSVFNIRVMSLNRKRMSAENRIILSRFVTSIRILSPNTNVRPVVTWGAWDCWKFCKQ